MNDVICHLDDREGNCDRQALQSRMASVSLQDWSLGEYWGVVGTEVEELGKCQTGASLYVNAEKFGLWHLGQ